MSWQDLINGLFEAGGSVFIFMNVRQILIDKMVRGLYWPAIAFFAGWGWWNLYYYVFLEQMFSWLAGLFVTLANTWWVYLLFKYRRM